MEWTRRAFVKRGGLTLLSLSLGGTPPFLRRAAGAAGNPPLQGRRRVLVALFQGNGESIRHRHLVGIEEPESALHPAAAAVLVDSLTDAAQMAQVVVTSHSADLLDNDAIPDRSILAVLSEHAETRIGPLDEAGRTTLRDRLFTAGELLRMDQLHPDPEQSAPRQLDLFESRS